MTAGASGRRTLVLGAGIGQAVAAAAAARGDTVVLASGTRPPGFAITHIPADLATREGAEMAVDSGIDRLGGIDVLVTCAGARVVRGSFAEHSDDDWYAAFTVNVLNIVRACQRGLSSLSANHGVLVNVAALHDPFPNPQVAPYSAAEAAADAVTRALAIDMFPRGVRVFGVVPAAAWARPALPVAAEVEARGHQGVAARLSIVGGSGARVALGDRGRRAPVIEFVLREKAAQVILRLIDDPDAAGATYLVDSGMLRPGR